MKNGEIVWIASYPRSGNTFLRTILWHCFGQPSASVYPDDLHDHKKLAEYVGHVEHTSPGKIQRFVNSITLIKTHDPPRDNGPAIYVIRDGRAAIVSLWNFYGKAAPLEDFVEGKHQFGPWAYHVATWNPWVRPNTLLLRYEDIKNDLPGTLKLLSQFLQRDIIKDYIPDRNTIADQDGRWVRRETNWREELSGPLLERFNQISGNTLLKAGYTV